MARVPLYVAFAVAAAWISLLVAPGLTKTNEFTLGR
jgi:hypothetical protein